MAENLTPKKYIDSSNMKQILTAVKNDIPTTVAELTDSADYIKTTDIKTTLDENSTNDDVYGGKAIFDAIKNNCVGKETVLYNSSISATGTYTLADDVNNYDLVVIIHNAKDTEFLQSVTLTKKEVSKTTDGKHYFLCAYGYSSRNNNICGYFNNNTVTITQCVDESITSITGYKFGQVTVENTITNPSPAASYSTDEQLTGGTWIDGKPVYEKTVFSSFTNYTVGEYTTFAIPFGNINVISIDGMINYDSTFPVPVNYHYEKPSDNNIQRMSTFYSKNSGSIVTFVYSSKTTDYNNANYFVTVRYTKPTD